MTIPLAYYVISGACNLLTSAVLFVLLLLKSRHSRTSRLFSLFCLCIAFWSLFYILFLVQNDQAYADFYLRLCMAGVLYMPSVYLHFINNFLSLNLSFRLLALSYGLSFVFSFFLFTDFYATASTSVQVFNFWLKPGPFFHLALLHFSIIFSYCFYVLWQKSRSLTGLKRKQVEFVLIGIIIGILSGASNYFVWYRIPIPPILNVFVSLYIMIQAYAIIRYRLMDIRVAAVSSVLFILVYAVTLGVPFYHFYQGNHFFALCLMLFLASVGPFAFMYFQRKTHDAILGAQRRYQATLIQASSGMGNIRDLRRLVKLIVRVMIGAVKQEHMAIYLHEKDTDDYRLAASLSQRGHVKFTTVFPKDVDFIVDLADKSRPVLAEDFLDTSDTTVSSSNDRIAVQMEELGAAMLVPISIDSKMLAFAVLGRKSSGEPYSSDDISVFMILANQTALAIENARFYQETRDVFEQLAQAEKLATIGTMADGMSHQINNRFHVLGFIAGDLRDAIQCYRRDPRGEAPDRLFDELEHGFDVIEENVMQGAEVVKGVLNYSRHAKTEKEPVELRKLIESSLQMVSLKVRITDFEKELVIPDDANLVNGNFVQLQEVLFNIIDNAHYSMMEKKSQNIEPAYVPRLKFLSIRDGGKVWLYIEDNAMGISTENQKKLFTPFFTTKASSRKGNGLGLFVMQKIIQDDHGGSISFSSEYLKGVRITIGLPAAG